MEEGKVVKGGVNKKPQTKRPDAPKGQKVISIEGGRSKESELATALHAMREGMQEQVEFFTLIAPLHKAKFDALKKEGFTDAQALELSKDLYGGITHE